MKRRRDAYMCAMLHDVWRKEIGEDEDRTADDTRLSLSKRLHRVVRIHFDVQSILQEHVGRLREPQCVFLREKRGKDGGRFRHLWD